MSTRRTLVEKPFAYVTPSLTPKISHSSTSCVSRTGRCSGTGAPATCATPLALPEQHTLQLGDAYTPDDQRLHRGGGTAVAGNILPKRRVEASGRRCRGGGGLGPGVAAHAGIGAAAAAPSRRAHFRCRRRGRPPTAPVWRLWRLWGRRRRRRQHWVLVHVAPGAAPLPSDAAALSLAAPAAADPHRAVVCVRRLPEQSLCPRGCRSPAEERLRRQPRVRCAWRAAFLYQQDRRISVYSGDARRPPRRRPAAPLLLPYRHARRPSLRPPPRVCPAQASRCSRRIAARRAGRPLAAASGC